MRKVNKFFKILSGRPKDGDIIECIKFFPFVILCIISIGLVIYGFNINNPIPCLMALVFAWQNGWSMSIERFINHERKEDNKIDEK